MPERNGRARIEKICESGERMEREFAAVAESTAAVTDFNVRLAAKKIAWSWPTISAALTSKHHWLVIACDSCGTIIDMDLRVKRRDPLASIRVALDDVRCPRCNGHGRTRITGLARFPSI